MLKFYDIECGLIIRNAVLSICEGDKMGILGYSQKELDSIESVVILNTTNLYRRTSRWGFSINNSGITEPFVMDGGSSPAGAVTNFSVTYKNGLRKIVKAKAGTLRYEQLVQFALDPPNNPARQMSQSYNSHDEDYGEDYDDYDDEEIEDDNSGYERRNPPQPTPPPYKPIKLGKNELPGGKYLIGQDIPPGAYDFTWVWGSAFFQKYKPGAVIPENVNYSNYIGAQYDYEYRQLLHVECEVGETIDLNGNVVVKIARSPKIKLDL